MIYKNFNIKIKIFIYILILNIEIKLYIQNTLFSFFKYYFSFLAQLI